MSFKNIISSGTNFIKEEVKAGARDSKNILVKGLKIGVRDLCRRVLVKTALNIVQKLIVEPAKKKLDKLKQIHNEIITRVAEGKRKGKFSGVDGFEAVVSS